MKTPTKEQIKQAKLNLKNAKKVVIQVAALLAAARKGNALQNETDEFMFIVASTITEWEKIRSLEYGLQKL